MRQSVEPPSCVTLRMRKEPGHPFSPSPGLREVNGSRFLPQGSRFKLQKCVYFSGHALPTAPWITQTQLWSSPRLSSMKFLCHAIKTAAWETSADELFSTPLLQKKKLDSLMWKLHILGDMLMHERLEPPGRGAVTDRHAGSGVTGTCRDCLSLSVEELFKSSHFRDF